jgi:uncharacterized protein (DUF983 family)
MGDAINQVHQEFWRPPMQLTSEVAANQDLSETCPHCGTEFIVGSKFCHSCGRSRPGLRDGTTIPKLPGLAELTAAGEQLGLTTASFVAFLIGVICLVGALAVGIIFGAKTVLDWQAIQLWRIEWLLGAIAAFVAAMLLRKSKS